MQALSPAERESAYRSGQQAFAQSVTDTIKKDPGEGGVRLALLRSGFTGADDAVLARDIIDFARGKKLTDGQRRRMSTNDSVMRVTEAIAASPETMEAIRNRYAEAQSRAETVRGENKTESDPITGTAQDNATPNRSRSLSDDSIAQENANVNVENLTNEGGSQRLDPRTPIEEIRRTMGEEAAVTELFRRESGLFQTAGRNGDDFETLFSQAPLRMVDRQAAETAYRAGIKDRFYAAGENGESFESVRGFAPERMQAAAAEAYQKGLDSRARNAEQIYSGETREGGGYGRPDASGKQPGLVWNEEAQQLTPQERKNIAALARKLGKRVYIQTGLVTDDGRPALGKINDAAIYADPSRGTLVQDIIVHEFSHRMKQLSPDSWQKYADYAINDLKKTGRYDGIYSEFTKHYDGMAESEIHEEMAADYAYKMFDSEESLTELIRQDKPLAEKIKDVWFALLEKLGRDVTLKRTKNMWKMCLTEAGKTAERGGNQGGTKYKIAYTTDNQPVVVVEEDFLKGIDPKDRKKETRKKLAEFSRGIQINGRFIAVNKTTRGEFTFSKDSQHLWKNSLDVYSDKMRIAENIDDAVKASTDYVGEAPKHERKDNIKEFARGSLLVQVGKNQYDADVVVGWTGEQMVLYDIVKMKRTSFDIKKEAPSLISGTTQNTALPRSGGMLPNDSVTQGSGVVKGENSSNEGKNGSGAKYMLVGKINGYDAYRSDFPESMPQEKRLEKFKERIAAIFNLGRVSLNTDTKKITVAGDKFTMQKNVYGDKKASDKEADVKIDALYDIADILRKSRFVKKEMEESYKDPSKKPKNAAHKNVKYWYKFRNTIVFDGDVYDVTFNIRDKGKEQIQYLMTFVHDEKKTAQVSHTVKKTSGEHYPAPSSNSTVTQLGTNVKGKNSSNQGKNMLPFEGAEKRKGENAEKLVMVKGEADRAAADISKQFGTDAEKTKTSINKLYSFIIDRATSMRGIKQAAVKTAKQLAERPMKEAENVDGTAIIETINSHSGETIGALWDALSKKFPDLFGSEDTTVAERLARISEVRKQIENGETVTAVDRAEYDSRINELSEAILKGFDSVKKQGFSTYEYEMNKAEEKAEFFRVSRERERLQPQIDRNYNYLKSKLMNPKTDRYVPEHMRGEVAKFLSLFNDKVVRTPWDLKNPEKMTAVEVKKAQLYDAYCAVMREKLGEEYNDANELHKAVFDKDLADELRELKESVPTDENGNFVKLSEMTPRELNTVGKMIAGINHAIVSENKLFRDGIRKTVSELGESVIAEAGERKAQRRAKHKNSDGEYRSLGEGKGAAGKVLDVIGDEWSFNELAARDMFERLGGTMKKMYKELRKSFNDFTWKRRDMIEMMRRAIKKIDTDKISGKNAEVLSFETADGKTVRMTKGQVMSLYALSKRKSAWRHIMTGGVTIGSTDLKSNESLGRGGVIKLSEADVNKITSVLSKEEIGCIEKVVGYMTGPCAKMANEVSMKLYGYEKYGEKWYFPIKASSDALATYSGEYGEGNVRTQSFTKKTNDKATNPIEINDFFETAIGHIDGISLYSTMALPMLDMERVMNYKQYDKTGDAKVYKTNVRSELKSAYGAGAVNYINKLFEDLNGQTKAQGDRIGDALMALQKKAAIGLNLRVLLQQPTAVVRALYYLPDLRDWLPGNPAEFLKDPGKLQREMLEHSAIAYWKSLGFYDIGIGRSIYDIAMGKESTYDKIAMGAYGKADDITWTAIWGATKNKIKRLNPGMDTGSAEFMQMVSDEFDRIIDASQVVDTPLHRTQSMRSKNAFTKAETAYMSEPLKMLNMMRTETVIAQRAGKTAKAVSGLAVIYAAQALATALGQSIPDLWRDKDEDNWYTEDGQKISTWNKWFSGAADDFLGNLDPTGMMPYVKRIASFATEYSQQSMEWQSISRLISASKNLTEDKLPISARVINFAGALAAVGGVSIRTAFRDLQGIGELAYRQVSSGEYGSYMLKKWECNIRKPENREKFFKYYKQAMKNGHLKDAELILADYTYNLRKGSDKAGKVLPPSKKDIKAGKDSREHTVIEAMSKLYKKTGDEGIFYSMPGQTLDINGEKKKLSDSDYKKYAAGRNERLMELAYELVTSDFYKGGKNEAETMTDSEKVTAFGKVKEYADKSVKKDNYKKDVELEKWEKEIYSGESTLAEYIKEKAIEKRRKPIGGELHKAYLKGENSYEAAQNKYKEKGYSEDWIGNAEEYAAKSSKSYKKELEKTKERLQKAADGLPPAEAEYAKDRASAAATYYTKKKHIAGYSPKTGIVPSYEERAEPYGMSIEDYIRYKAGARTAAQSDGNNSMSKTELWAFINSTTNDPDLRLRMYLVLKNKSWK